MKIIGLAETSDLTHVPEATLRYWRHLNSGPPSFRIGRRIAYDEAEVLKWVESQRRSTGRGDGA